MENTFEISRLISKNMQNNMLSSLTDDISEITLNKVWLSEYKRANHYLELT